MYYDIVKSGARIKKLRMEAGFTRQCLAEQVGISVDALRKIEQGTNGAKIDTLVSIAEVLHASLDFLVCGSKYTIGLGDITIGLNQKEIQFIRSMVFHVVKNIDLLKE